MSLALPYPSMVFVPLDVLTADEMNHIVANYEFIADQLPVADVVTNSNGTAIKFENGIMICFKTFASGAITTGSTYGDTQWNFPVSFVETPTFLAMPTRGSSDYGMYLPKINAISNTYAQCIWLNINNTIATNKSLFFSGHFAIGRWQ